MAGAKGFNACAGLDCDDLIVNNYCKVFHLARS